MLAMTMQVAVKSEIDLTPEEEAAFKVRKD
jgi:hypothetical protein